MSYSSFHLKMKNSNEKEPRRQKPEEKRKSKGKPDYSEQRRQKRGE